MRRKYSPSILSLQTAKLLFTKRLRLILILLAVILLGCVALLFIGPTEPSYHGKTLTKWLAQAEASNTWDEESAQAIRQIGTNAIPTLLRLVAAHDGSIKSKWANLLNHQKLFHIHLPTASEKRSFAQHGFAVLGTNAAPAIPGLLRLIKDSDTSVRWDALQCLLDVSPKNDVLKSALLELSKHSDAAHSLAAAILLQQYFPADGSRPGLINTSTSPHQLAITQPDLELTNLDNLSLLIRYAEGEGDGSPYILQAVAETDLAPPGLMKPELFVCPATGHKPGAIKSVSEWSDYIYVGKMADYMIGAALVICPPENHGGKYGYVLFNGVLSSRLPADQVRRLITNPFCMVTNLSEGLIKHSVTNVVIQIPDRLKPYYSPK